MVTLFCRNLIGQWFPACWSLIWNIACSGAGWVCRISYCDAKSCIKVQDNTSTSAANLLSPINPTCRSLDCGPGDDSLRYRESKQSQRMNPAGLWTSNLLPVRGQCWQNDKFDPLNLTVVSTQLSLLHLIKQLLQLYKDPHHPLPPKRISPKPTYCLVIGRTEAFLLIFEKYNYLVFIGVFQVQ